jgi:hypothetical protein
MPYPRSIQVPTLVSGSSFAATGSALSAGALGFDLFQIALLPLMAYMLYSLLNKKGLAVTFVVIVLVLLMPFPTPQWGPSVSYYWQWGEGQAKVFETFLLLLAMYLAQRGKPYLSGVALAFGFFDPRFGLLALPVFAYYNWGNLKKAFGSLVVALVVSNVMLLYPGLGQALSAWFSVLVS